MIYMDFVDTLTLHAKFQEHTTAGFGVKIVFNFMDIHMCSTHGADKSLG